VKIPSGQVAGASALRPGAVLGASLVRTPVMEEGAHERPFVRGPSTPCDRPTRRSPRHRPVPALLRSWRDPPTTASSGVRGCRMLAIQRPRASHVSAFCRQRMARFDDECLTHLALVPRAEPLKGTRRPAIRTGLDRRKRDWPFAASAGLVRVADVATSLQWQPDPVPECALEGRRPGSCVLLCRAAPGSGCARPRRWTRPHRVIGPGSAADAGRGDGVLGGRADGTPPRSLHVAVARAGHRIPLQNRGPSVRVAENWPPSAAPMPRIRGPRLVCSPPKTEPATKLPSMPRSPQDA